jgi:hypothetical protein
MSSYQGSTSVRADAQTVFTFVSNPENLAKYVPCIRHADVGYGDVVHIQGECPHGDFRGVGGLFVDAENLRMRWDSRANLKYRGWLQVTDHEDESLVSIHLEFDPGMEPKSNEEFTHVLKDHPPTIQQTLDEALLRIKRSCEIPVGFQYLA